ncbi:hypothetical protein OROGR_026547 [Orobanche gracilis]
MGYWISSIPAFPLLIILPTLISSLCFQIASAEDTDLMSICSSTDTESNTFAENLNKLWTDLNNITSFDHLFWNQSYGNSRNQVYALAMCRGDVSSQDCKNCLSAATSGIINEKCPNASRAIYWREYCHVKYSDFNFFEESDTVNNFTMTNKDYINSDAFRDAVIWLLGNLTQNATKDTTGYMFANGKIKNPGEGDNNIFGMVQCTRDLSLKNCTNCLKGVSDGLIPKIDWSTDDGTPKGGRFVTGSCLVRYEEYDFIFPNPN